MQGADRVPDRASSNSNRNLKGFGIQIFQAHLNILSSQPRSRRTTLAKRPETVLREEDLELPGFLLWILYYSIL